jgi:DNA integrity scanning protein DisA with diadenylate cyclase activity
MWRAFASGILDALDATAALDIALLALLLYPTLVGLQRVRRRNALRGALLLGGIYLLARQFNMVLTSDALEAFFAIMLVALVMIYREELRRLVEQVARLGQRRPATAGAELTLAEQLGDCMFELADNRWGALIVLAGEEPVDAHLTGGTALGGVPSSPLLLSIFDPSSAGHDGALVIESGTVSCFGAHLPLSKNLDELGGRGTRHAAALGLSEKCDATCVVVSEERGQVSLARGGQLWATDDLAEASAAFAEQLGARPKAQRPWQTLLHRHHGTKLVALALSAVAWVVLVYGGQVMQQRIAVPIQTQGVGPKLRLVSVIPTELRVTASGVRRDFALVRPGATRVLLPLDAIEAGHQRVTISAEHVVLPKGLTFRGAYPPSVVVTLRPRLDAVKAAPEKTAQPKR